jgi:HEAT repeat protein
LPPPRDCNLAIDRYVKEVQREVRWEIAWFLGSAKAKPAVPVLIAELRKNPAAHEAVSALSEIGDTTAVPAILRAAAAETSNRHIYHGALGRLATAEAVQFLIDNLDEYGAVEALFKSRSPRALPALKKHMEKLQELSKPDDLGLTVTRVAVLRLSEADPREHLMLLAEDTKEDKGLREECLKALRDYEVAPLAPRILKLYTTESDDWFRAKCIRLLKDQKLKGVTEAMVEHALTTKGGGLTPCEYDLLEALNYRLHTSFRSVRDLRAYLRDQRDSLEK